MCSNKGKGKAAVAAAPAAAAAVQDEEDLGKEVDAMPQFASAFGKRFRSCKGVRVTEEDTEYVIVCVKHIYDAHILLQFNCTNTISDQVCLVSVDLCCYS